MANKVVICGVDTSTLPKSNNKKLEELMEQIKQGNKNAREEFIIHNMRLVLSIVKRFSSNKNNIDDIFTFAAKKIEEVVPTLSKPVKETILTKAYTMMAEEDERLDSKAKVKALEKALGVSFDMDEVS